MTKNNSYSGDIDAIAGERWFPLTTSLKEDLPHFWGDWGVCSEVDKLQAVLLHRPGSEVENIDVNKARFLSLVNPELMRKQHDHLAQIYREHDVKVYYTNQHCCDHPNSIFVRDLYFMTPEGAIVSRPAMDIRRGEARYIALALSQLGIPILKTINGQGIFEGANAMWVDQKTVILATGSRTNRCGFQQLEMELIRLGVEEIIPMQIPFGHAHIDGILNFASNEHVMIHAPQVPYDVCNTLRKKGFKILEAPSQTEAKITMGINFVAIKPGLVIQPEGNPRCKALLEDNGVKVISIDISEILKGWGAIHCVTGFLKRG